MLKLPEKSYTDHIASVGKTGSGKTNTAKVIVEKHVADGRRVCVLDPIKSDWWGITSNQAGDGPGLPFVILGGPRQHAPLPPESGAIVAELVGTGKLPRVIIDMSELDDRQRAEWYVAFASKLIAVMQGVLVLVLEEADLFAPKERFGNDKENLRLMYSSRLARMGRSKGIRLLVNCTRTQKLHNDLLGSCETLLAHRMSLAADRAPVMEWLEDMLDKKEAAEIERSLGSLKTGEGYVCFRAGEHLEKTHFPKSTTYDNTSTPTDDGHGGGAHDVKMAEVDLSALQQTMAAAIAKAKEDDPDELRKQIRDLRKQLTDERLKPIDVHAGEVGKLQDEIATLREQLRDSENRLIATESAMSRVADSIATIREGVFSATGTIVTHRETFPTRTNSYSPREASESRATQAPERTTHKALDASPVPAVAPLQDRPAAGFGGTTRTRVSVAERSLEKGPGLILDAVAWWHMLGIETPTRAQVAAVAGYAVTGGSFQKYVSTLSSMKLIQLSPGAMSITKAGGDLAAWPDSTPSRRALHERVLGILDGGPRKILNVLLEHGPHAMGRTQLGELSGYEATGGSFQKYLSTLSSMGLITYPKRTTAAAAAWLFDSWIGADPNEHTEITSTGFTG